MTSDCGFAEAMRLFFVKLSRAETVMPIDAVQHWDDFTREATSVIRELNGVMDNQAEKANQALQTLEGSRQYAEHAWNDVETQAGVVLKYLSTYSIAGEQSPIEKMLLLELVSYIRHRGSRKIRFHTHNQHSRIERNALAVAMIPESKRKPFVIGDRSGNSFPGCLPPDGLAFIDMVEELLQACINYHEMEYGHGSNAASEHRLLMKVHDELRRFLPDLDVSELQTELEGLAIQTGEYKVNLAIAQSQRAHAMERLAQYLDACGISEHFAGALLDSFTYDPESQRQPSAHLSWLERTLKALQNAVSGT